MTVPNKFNSSTKYFESTMSFLKEFSWIYKTSNTNFIKDGVLNEFPIEWKNYFQQISNENLNLFPSNENKDQVPESLKLFQNIVNDLKPPNDHNLLKFIETPVYFRKMNPKKLHEIAQLSKFIADICQNDIDILIDFGSGLGYLSEILYKNYNYKILGLECDKERIQNSIQRQQNYYPNSINCIFYKNLLITESCGQIILEYLKELFPTIENPKIAIIGLHSCADLTITSMKLFFELKIIEKLIIMPCCYHKLELIENTTNNNKFKNFPLSDKLRNVNNLYKNDELLNRPFLRLACQETLSRWKNLSEKEHFEHGKEMFIRGILQNCLNENESVSKVRNYKKILFESTNNEFDQIKKQYQLKDKFNTNCIINWTEEHHVKFQNLLLKYPEGYKLSEGLTCLQTSLQSLFENLVLYDRICFMEEQAINKNIKIVSSYHKIMDDALSPRCFALIAEKRI